MLAQELHEYVVQKTNNQGRAHAILAKQFLNQDKYYTRFELEDNPQIVFEKMEDYCDYSITITLYDGSKGDDYSLDYTLVHDIYGMVFELGLKPMDITFFYNRRKEEDNSRVHAATINHKRFSEINTYEDLIPIFQDEMRKRESYGW